MTNHGGEPILVLGGTGKTGRRLVSTLRQAGRTVRAASRSGEVRFDWSAAATWAATVDGASAAYLIAPADPAPVPALVEQAVAAGVRRFVLLSARGLDRYPDDVFAGTRAAEQAVRASGVEWSIVRPNNFDQNFDEDLWQAPLRAGRLALPIGPVGEPFVDAQDVADVAAVLLTEPGHHERMYELTGPRSLTFPAAVETIAAAAGRPMAYEELSPEAYRAELRAHGMPADVVHELDAMFAGMRAGSIGAPADGVRQVLGRDPLDFAAYADRAARAGAWS